MTFRLSQANFRFYEKLIGVILARHPIPTIFNPKDYGKTQGTFEGRLRDAMLSLSTNNWQTTLDLTRFASVYPNIIVSSRDDGTVAVGTRAALTQLKEQKQAAFVAGDPTSFEMNEILMNGDRVLFLCYLAHHRLLSRPLHLFSLYGHDETTLTNQFDILLEGRPDGSFTLI